MSKQSEFFIQHKIRKESEKTKRKFDEDAKWRDKVYRDFDNRTKTQFNPIPNMTDALRKVRESEITHPEDYLRITGNYRPMRNMRTK